MSTWNVFRGYFTKTDAQRLFRRSTGRQTVNPQVHSAVKMQAVFQVIYYKITIVKPLHQLKKSLM